MRNARTSRDPGQIILVGALALAIVLVGIALVLNASIFAENLATRANQQESANVVALESEVARGTGVAMNHLHHDVDAHTSYSHLESKLDAGIDRWSNMVVRDSARGGKYIDAEYVSMTKGTRIVQDKDQRFLPRNPSSGVLELDIEIGSISESWVLTPNATRVRDFSMTVNHSKLGGDTLVGLEAQAVETVMLDLELGGSIDLGPLSVDEAPFAVAYDVNDDGTFDHTFAIYRSTTGAGDVNVTYVNQETGATRTCTVENVDENFTVDVSNGWVEGGDGACSEVFAFQSEISNPYQLMYLEGDQIGGTYEFIVDSSTSSFSDEYHNLLTSLLGVLGLGDPTFEDYYHPHPSDSAHDDTYAPENPYVEPAIYSARVQIDYRSDSMSYESTIRVAPNEP